jgi:hypothetical protein
MNKVDYNKLMENTINKFNGEKPKLLLHACCAPCSSACLERLHDYFDITVLFYNPNIEDEEYFKRKDELLRFIKETGWATTIDCDHDKERFYELAYGLEDEPEGGKRCAKCFLLRLEKTAQIAKENGFDYFATTLTISPLKNATTINAIGESLEKKYEVKWLYSDFKKKGGYLRSIELSRAHCLYRQNYCGCIYSERQSQKTVD